MQGGGLEPLEKAFFLRLFLRIIRFSGFRFIGDVLFGGCGFERLLIETLLLRFFFFFSFFGFSGFSGFDSAAGCVTEGGFSSVCIADAAGAGSTPGSNSVISSGFGGTSGGGGGGADSFRNARIKA